FKEILEKEDVSTYVPVQPSEMKKLEKHFPNQLDVMRSKIRTKVLEPFPNELVIFKEGENLFEDTKVFLLEAKEEFAVTLNLLPRGTRYESITTSIRDTNEKREKKIEDWVIHALDWNKIYLELVAYKHEKGWNNIIFTPEHLKAIISGKYYILFCDNEKIVNPTSFKDLMTTNEIVLTILKKYVENFYLHKYQEWEKQINISLDTLKANDETILKEYTLLVKDKAPPDTQLENHIEYVEFQRSLFTPLIIKDERGIVITIPEGLNLGEKEFIKDIHQYIQNNEPNVNIYLLRNYPRRGVGFFNNVSFYPDFIMWVLENDTQKVIFIDPKGLVFFDIDHPKLKLHQHLKELYEKRFKKEKPEVKFDALIISTTPFDTFKSIQRMQSLKEEDALEKYHILFQRSSSDRKNENYIEMLFKYIRRI
ncbi:MAG: hypothetical protein QXE05_09485, partial [Nitrososphaeria archaeon]